MLSGNLFKDCMFCISWLQKHPNEIALGILWIISIILVYNYYNGGFVGLQKLLLTVVIIIVGGISVVFTIGYFALRHGYNKAIADAELAKLEDDFMTRKGV